MVSRLATLTVEPYQSPQRLTAGPKAIPARIAGKPSSPAEPSTSRSVDATSCAGSGATSITASPISLTILAGGSTTSSASRDEPPGHAPELLAGDRLAELGEADEVGERDRAVAAGAELARRQLLGGDHLLAQHLAQVQAEDVLEPRPGKRQQRARHRLEPAGQRVLVGARLEQRLPDERAHRLGVASHPAAEHALDLQRLVVREPGLAVLLAHPRPLEVALAVDALVRPGHGEAERAPVRLEEVEPRRRSARRSRARCTGPRS